MKDLGFYKVESARDVRWYQKEYFLVGVFVAEIAHPFMTIKQQAATEGKFWLTVKKFLDGGIIMYIIDLDNGQGRAEKTIPLTEYLCKSLLLDWENKLKTYNIHK